MTQRTPYRTLTLATVTAGALLAAGCAATDAQPPASSDTGTGELTSATLMLNWTPNAHHAGIFYAYEHGLYEDAGIDLNIVEPGAEVGAEAAVAEGQATFGISQAESLLPAREAGMDLQAIATLLPVNDSVLMGLETTGLTTDPASLAGLTYGGYGGALETEIMSELTACAGADPDAIDFIDIGNVDYLSGLAQDRFDVTWVFGGWDGLRAEAEREDVVILPLAEHESCIPNWYTPIIVTHGSDAAEDAELTSAFLAATAAGYDAVVQDPAEGAAALMAHAPELDATLVDAATEYYAPLFTQQGEFGQMDTAVWQRFTEFLVSADMLESADAVEQAWTNEYLPEP